MGRFRKRGEWLAGAVEGLGRRMSSEDGQAIVNSVAAQAMDVDYGHVDVTGVSSGGIKPGDVHAASLVSVNVGGGQNVMMMDKGVRSSTVGLIEPWSVEEDRERLITTNARAL